MAAPSYVGSSSDSSNFTGATGGSATFDIGTRTNGLIIVKFGYLASNVMSALSGTWNGVSIAIANHTDGGASAGSAAVLYLTNPANGSNTLALSWTIDFGGTVLASAVIVEWYDGAHQTQGSVLDDADGTTGTGNPQITLQPTENDTTLVDVAYSEDNNTLSPDTGQTATQNVDLGTRTVNGSYLEQSTQANRTMGWTDPGVADTFAISAANFKAPASGTQYQQSVSGSVTPTGAPIKQPQASRAGSIAPSGAKTAQISLFYAGTIAPAGAHSKTPITEKTGSTSFSGDVLGIPGKNLDGSITPTSTLVGFAQKVLAGAITPVGTLIVDISRSLAGSIAPSGIGDGIKTVLQDVAGSIAPAGSLVRQVSTSLAGTLGSAGALIVQTSKTIVGTLPSAGSLIRDVFKILTGSVAPSGLGEGTTGLEQSVEGTLPTSGALTRLVSTSLSGALSSAGNLVIQTIKSFTGSITPSGDGTGIKTVLASIAGSIAPTGALVKHVATFLSGAMSSAATLVIQLSRDFTGSISPVGSLLPQLQKFLSGALATVSGVLSYVYTPISAIRVGALTFAALLREVVSLSQESVDSVTLEIIKLDDVTLEEEL